MDRKSKIELEEKELQVMLRTLPFVQTEFSFLNPDHSLIILGNGFDIMHGAKSSYLDFASTIGKNSSLRYNMETYLAVEGDLWSNLEESLGKLDYSMFLNSGVLDMWLENFGAYNPDAQAADFFAAVETAIAPTFDIPRELKRRFVMWLKTLRVEKANKVFTTLSGNYKVLNFNYTEFIEVLYGVPKDNICYIHGCRKNCKPDGIILGHKSGTEVEQWDKVDVRPIKFKNEYKRYIMESAIETAINEALWYDDTTIKNCDKIIKQHINFFEGLTNVEDVYVIGHSLSEVDYPYFEEVFKRCDAKWHIGYHSLADLKRLVVLVDKIGMKSVSIFRV